MLGPIHHYGVTVSDIDRSLEFYRDVLGFPVVDRLTNAGPEISAAVGVDDVELEVVFLDGGSTLVELLRYERPSGGDANEGVRSNDVGASHVCLRVDNVDAAYESLRETVPFFSEPRTLEGGVKIVYLTDPDGNVLELLEKPK
jgi:catechol 2,3-dioxygenase-like lactoylglutathione lyase family enzyme